MRFVECEARDACMWMRLGLNISDLEKRPSGGAIVAASFRQLLRAYDADDQVALWEETGSFCMRIRLFIRDLLALEPSWDSKGRWLEGFGNGILYKEPGRIHVADAMVWGLRPDIGPRMWADPFEVHMELTADRSDLASYTVRFGDRRGFPGEDFQSSLSRIKRDLEDGTVEWAHMYSSDLSVL
jgi:hypothetical protein